MKKKRHNIFQWIGRGLDLIEQQLYETTYKEQYEIQNVQLDKQALHITVLRRQKKELLNQIDELQKRIEQYEKPHRKRKTNS